jgi:hypothetical protein
VNCPNPYTLDSAALSLAFILVIPISSIVDVLSMIILVCANRSVPVKRVKNPATLAIATCSPSREGRGRGGERGRVWAMATEMTMKRVKAVLNIRKL